MAQKQSTPGIVRKEVDLSEIVAPAGTSVGALVGQAIKGPVNRRVLVTSDKEFVTKFGSPDSSTMGYDGYAAIEFLKESNALYFVRATYGNEAYASVTVSTMSASEITSDAIPALSSTELFSKSGYADGNTSKKIYEIENAGFNAWDVIRIASIAPGTDGNRVGIVITTSAVSALQTLAVSASYDWANAYTTPGEVFKIEVYLKDKVTDTSFPTTPVETWLVAAKYKIDDAGTQMFAEDAINGYSSYIYVKINGGVTGTNSIPMNLKDSDTLQSCIVPLDGGADCTTSIGTAVKGSAWSLFSDVNKVSVNILICPEPATTEGKQLQVIVGSLAGTRMDCICTIQADSASTMVDKELIAANANYNSSYPSYTAIYAGWDKIYDAYNKRYIYIPKSIYGASLMARTDRVANTWDAPAGVNRGGLPSIGQNIVFSDAEIGYLYDRNINTSKFINGTGNVMWGQKTAQRKKSALDRINVRRLLIYIENSIEPSLLPFLFEPNNARTRTRVQSICDNFLASVQSGSGVEQYQVVCDESNNTAQVIDNNQLYVDLYVQPTKTIEFITLQTIITKSGVSFAEVI